MYDNGLSNFISKVVAQQDTTMVNTLLAKAGIKDEKRKEQIHQLAENTRRFLKENATASADVVSFVPAYIPMLTRLLPSIITLEIVGVQPMNAPVGVVWAYRMYLSNVNSSIANGALTTNYYNGLLGLLSTIPDNNFVKATSSAQTIYRIVAVSMTGGTQHNTNVGKILAKCTLMHRETENQNVFLKITKDDGTAVTDISVADAIHQAIADGYAVKIYSNTDINYLVGTVAPLQLIYVNRNWDKDYLYSTVFKFYTGGDSQHLEGYEGLEETKGISYKVESKPISAKTKRLRFDFTMETLQDTQALYKGYDIQAEMVKMAVKTLALEIDQEILFHLRKLAGQNTIAVFNYQTVSGYDLPSKVKTLLVMIEAVASDIAKDTRIGAGNFIVTNPKGVALLSTLPTFSRTQDFESLGAGVQKAGMLSGFVKVFLDPYSTEDALYIGHKGANEGATGIIFSPYLPIQVKTLTDPNTFNTNNLAITRYAITDNLYGSQKFYRKIRIDNFNYNE